MRRFLFGAALAAMLAPAAALAQGFKVGDHVSVGHGNDTGIVLEVGHATYDGGTRVRVHIERLAPGHPTVGVWYDSASAPVIVGPRPPPPPTPAIPAPPDDLPSAAICQPLIRANYPPGGADRTMIVTFQSFEMIGRPPYIEPYLTTDANYNGGAVIQVAAAPIHTRYTVLTHYADPKTDDELRSYDAQYMCYQPVPGAGWVVKMVSSLPGGDTAQHIHKG